MFAATTGSKRGTNVQANWSGVEASSNTKPLARGVTHRHSQRPRGRRWLILEPPCQRGLQAYKQSSDHPPSGADPCRARVHKSRLIAYNLGPSQSGPPTRLQFVKECIACVDRFLNAGPEAMGVENLVEPLQESDTTLTTQS